MYMCAEFSIVFSSLILKYDYITMNYQEFKDSLHHERQMTKRNTRKEIKTETEISISTYPTTMFPVELSQSLVSRRNDWNDCYLLMFSKGNSGLR